MIEDKKILALLGSQDSASELLALGYSASELLAAGYSASELRAAGYSASELLALGYSASELLALGYSASELLALGYSASELLAAGYSASELRALNSSIPTLDRPYSRLLADIREKRRQHKQSTWGPEDAPPEEANICNTPMCTAGHLVNMGGAAGWALKDKYGWATAAALIHHKAHPDHSAPAFDAVPDEWAMAKIEAMAEIEASMHEETK